MITSCRTQEDCQRFAITEIERRLNGRSADSVTISREVNVFDVRYNFDVYSSGTLIFKMNTQDVPLAKAMQEEIKKRAWTVSYA